MSTSQSRGNRLPWEARRALWERLWERLLRPVPDDASAPDQPTPKGGD